ncbi:hypothetical protein TWF102_002356 [Orbilia oligospora]|uniref:DUF7330 domain-containing protein n=1 Tax=Orbilia oligospora TaxID=2813651 RepID=A0A7C8JA21_ORBOL|nr:hypothetical protein TWF103_000648 [Orbilia oligospora]KAF3105442.1 hypothetical protein TWF102_002356 [Orbilia oligospora]KAF3128748.1 hypothetical protein TWF594_011499 [Orbilia oligospora]
MPPPSENNGTNSNNNNNNGYHNQYNAYSQIPVDMGKIIADVRNSVESAMRSVPPMNMGFWGGPPCPGHHAAPAWSPFGGGGGGSSNGSESGRPTIPAFPKDDEIVVQVWTQAIKNSFNLKKSVSISTVSGSIKADIVPSPTPSTELFRKLTTQTNTGSQHITISTSLGPFMLDSSHTTMTGSIKAIYPDDWCGTIELSITHGSYKLGDAVVVRDVVDQNTRERQVLALRGNPREGEEFSTMKVTSKTGSVDVRFEKVPGLRNLTEEEVRAEEEEARKRGGMTGFSGPTTPTGGSGSGGGGQGGNKEQKERGGPAVFRPGDGSTSASYSNQPPPPPQHQQPPPNHHNNHPAAFEQRRQVVDEHDPDDLPPSYEQSEQENVQMQVAGRD